MAVSTQDHGDDGALVQAAQAGDGDAFGELYRRHYAAVRRACARRLFDAEEADEVAQASFVRAFERIDQCAGDRRFGPWVHVIARSMCMDAFRAKARVEPREEPLAGRDHRPNEPEESLLHQERSAQVLEALASLPDRQRRAVIARDWEELRPGEIADRLGLSVGAVDSLLLRARRRLALSYRRLAGEGGGGAGTSPIRAAAATVGAALVLAPQTVLAATESVAHTVQDTAGRAAGGVVGAVVSVGLTLGGGAEAPPEPVPGPPPAVAVAAVPDVVLPPARRPAPARPAEPAPGAPAAPPAQPAPSPAPAAATTPPPAAEVPAPTTPAAPASAPPPAAPAAATTATTTPAPADLLPAVALTVPVSLPPAAVPAPTAPPAPDPAKIALPAIPAVSDLPLPKLPGG